MSDIINADLASAIKSRQEGKNVLSWIENFGLHLLEVDCKPNVSFQNGESNIVVLRIRRKLGKDAVSQAEISIISAYHLCFLKTNGNGFARFCVKAACDEDVKGLKDLMVDKAHWTDESTKNWWKTVFRDLKHPIDEDTLRRKEVMVSDCLKMNMMAFIEKIQEIIGKAISKLDIDKQIISKVCIVEQFAMALPFRYVIERIFPNAKGSIFPFVWKEEKKPWLQNASYFQVPRGLLQTSLMTSHPISIGDILNQAKGILVTLPLSQVENEKFVAPSASIIENADLKWNELLRADVTPDYVVNRIAFKQLHLSMIADGFQTVYIKYDTDIVACTEYENGKYQIKSLFPNISEEEQKTAISKSGQGLKVDEVGTDLQVNNKKEEDLIDNNNVLIEENLQEPQDTNNTTSTDQETSSFIDFEEKADKIVFRIHQGVKRTAKSLETIARGYILRKFHEEIPQNASDSEKEVFWKKKFERCLSFEWQKIMLSNWKKYGQIEYGNFYSFLRTYQYKGLSGYLKGPKFSIIDSSVSALKDIRNLNAHADNKKILGIGFTKILFAFEYMLKIAEQQKDKKLLEILEKYKSEIEKEWDDDFTNYLNSKYQSL